MLRGFDAAVERHQRRVRAYAFYLLSNREEADDVTQEVLLKLYQHHRQVEMERLGSWLLRVTRNACYDLLRRRRARAADRHESLDGEEAVHLVDAAPDPEARAAAAGFRHRLLAELRALPEPYRSTVILREIQGLSYREIADVLEVPINTVRVHLHRGRRRLRERLREEVESAVS